MRRLTAVLCFSSIVLTLNVASGRTLLNNVRAISVEEGASNTVVTIEGSQTPTFTVFKLLEPVRLLVDVAGGNIQAVNTTKKVRNGVVHDIQSIQFKSRGRQIGRIIIGFDRDATYTVKTDGTRIRIVIDGTDRNLPQLNAQKAREALKRVQKALHAEKALLAELSAAKTTENKLRAANQLASAERKRLRTSLAKARAAIESLRRLLATKSSREHQLNELDRAAKARAQQKLHLLEKQELLTTRRVRALKAQKAQLAAQRAALKRAVQSAEQRRKILQKALALEQTRRLAAARLRRAEEVLARRARAVRLKDVERAQKAKALRLAEEKRIDVLKRSQKESTQLRLLADSLAKQLTALKAQLKASKKTTPQQLGTTSPQLANLKSQIRLQSQRHADAVAKLNAQKNRASKEYELAENGRKLAHAKLQKVRVQFDLERRNHDSARSRLRTTKAALKQRSETLKIALAEVVRKENALTRAHKELSSVKAARSQIEHNLQTLSADLTSVKEEAARLTHEKNALEGLISAYKNRDESQVRQAATQLVTKLLSTHRTKIKTIKDRLRKLRTEQKRHRRSLRQAAKTLNAVRTRLERERKDLAAVLVQKSLFQKQTEELRLQNVAAKKNLDTVRRDVRQMDSQLDRLATQRRKQLRRIALLQKKLQKLETQNGKRGDARHIRSMLAVRVKQITLLTKELVRLQAFNLVTAKYQQKRLDNALKKARAEARKTREGRRKLKQLRRILKAQTAKLQVGQTNSLAAQFSKKTAEIKELRAALNLLESNNRQTINLARIHDRRLRTELIAARKSAESARREVTRVRQQLVDGERRLKRLHRRFQTTLTSQKNAAEKRIAELQRKLDRAPNKAGVAKLESELGKARAELAEQAARWKAELSRHKTASAKRLAATQVAAQKRLDVERATNRTLKKALTVAHTRLSDSAQRHAETLKRIASLEKQLAATESNGKEAKALAAELAKARKTLSRLKSAMMKAKPKTTAKSDRPPMTAHKPVRRHLKASDTLARITDVAFRERSNRSIIDILVTGKPPYEIVERSPKRIVLLIRRARIPKLLERRLDTSDFYGPIKMISTYADSTNADRVRVVVTLNDSVRNVVRRKSNRIVWVFYNEPNQRTVARTHQSGNQVRHTAKKTQPNSRSNVQYEPTIVGGERSYAPPPSGGMVIPGGGIDFGVLNPLENRRKRRRYKGPKISLSIKDADIQEVLKFFAEQGNKNIIAGENVSGNVSIHLKDVEWELALDLILKSKGLDYVVEGGVYRVAPVEMIQKEFEQEVEKRKKLDALKKLVVKLVTVNYADADKLKERVKDILSKKGTVSTDVRTNTLIIKDIEEHVIASEDLVRRLDTQTPQVLIEARIVEASSNFSEEVGIQWGGNYTAAPAFGNETGLLFPGIIGLSGAADDPNSPTSGLISDTPNYAVNLPAAVGGGKGGGIGLTLGTVSGSANLSLRLTAAEERGTVKIISSPRIATLDNKEATISQGISIPISVVSSLGVNTQFFNAELRLKVKPHVTQDGNVNLSIDITKNEPNFSQRGASGNPTIERKEAHTQLLVRDGDTAVIGGIYTRNSSRSYKKVPLLGDIPVLGWLFKSRVQADKRTELILFITPRIINRTAARVRVD